MLSEFLLSKTVIFTRFKEQNGGVTVNHAPWAGNAAYGGYVARSARYEREASTPTLRAASGT